MARSPLFRKLMQIFHHAHLANLKAPDGAVLRLRQTAPRWTRRRFLRSAALATGTAIATHHFPHSPLAWSRQSPQIAVIGGGIAGLNAAYQLRKAGLTATLYEARNRLGGRIQSINGAVGSGLVSDLGGHFINSDHEDIIALTEEFGLTLFDRDEDAATFSFPDVAYFFNGRLRSEAEVADKLRPLARQIAEDAFELDEDFDAIAPQLDQLSVAQYLDRHATKILDPLIRVLIENSIRTEYGVEPEASSALQLIFNLPIVEGRDVEVLGASDEVFVVEGGSGRMIESLAAALPGQIRVGMQLTRLQQRGQQGYRLTFANNTTVDADYVVIAIPFTVLRHVDLQVNLPAALIRFIREVDLGANEKLLAGFNRKVWRQDSGFVQDIWTDLGFSSAWDGSQRQSDRPDGELTFFFGGNEVNALLDGSTSTRAQQILRQFNQAIPGAQSAANNQFLRTAWTLDPLTQGGYTNFRPGQLTTFGEFLYIESDDPEERQDVAVENLIFAGEHLSDAFYGYMNGAAETGRLAAEVIIRKLQASRTAYSLP